MDNNLGQVQNPIPTPTPMPVQPSVNPQMPIQPKGGSGFKLFVALLLVLLVVVIIGSGAYLYMGSTKPKTTYTPPANSIANVKTAPTAIPTQPQADIQSKIATDTQLDSDLQTLDSSINNLDSDSKEIDTSLLDKQTNLQ